MTDFINAFKEGLASAEKATQAKQEIKSVIDGLSRDLSQASGGKLAIGWQEFVVQRSALESLRVGLGAFAVERGLQPNPTYWALAAWNPIVGKAPIKELAKWSQDRRGYPCELTWSNEHHQCEDRQALENCLAALLKDPNVGETLYSLMQLKPKEEQQMQKNPPEKPAA